MEHRSCNDALSRLPSQKKIRIKILFFQRCYSQIMNWFQRQLYKPFFIRLFHWEYWNFSAVYVPIYIIWIGLCARAQSLFFFAASNPSIKNGGFLNESKKDIFQITPGSIQ